MGAPNCFYCIFFLTFRNLCPIHPNNRGVHNNSETDWFFFSIYLVWFFEVYAIWTNKIGKTLCLDAYFSIRKKIPIFVRHSFFGILHKMRNYFFFSNKSLWRRCSSYFSLSSFILLKCWWIFKLSFKIFFDCAFLTFYSSPSCMSVSALRFLQSSKKEDGVMMWEPPISQIKIIITSNKNHKSLSNNKFWKVWFSRVLQAQCHYFQ